MWKMLAANIYLRFVNEINANNRIKNTEFSVNLFDIRNEKQKLAGLRLGRVFSMFARFWG